MKDITFLQSEIPSDASLALRIGKTYDYLKSTRAAAAVCMHAKHKSSNVLLMARCRSGEAVEDSGGRRQSPSTPNQTPNCSGKPESI